MSADRGPFTVLVVCDGNVCRSAAVQFLLHDRLPGVIVESAGLHARSGSRLCHGVAAELLSSNPGSVSYIEGFRSRRTTGVDLTRFDLILAATRELRGDLVRANPELWNRFFTLREAATLLGSIPEAEGQMAPFARGDIVRIMNERRGAVSLARESVALPGFRGVDPLNIPDAHALGGRRHLGVIALSLLTAGEIGDSLATLLGLPIVRRQKL
jgi:protein-tyrosine phosphatase